MNQLGRIACGIWTPGWGIPDFLSVFLFLCFFLSKKKRKKQSCLHILPARFFAVFVI